MDTTQRTTPYEVITDRILTLLEQGTVPWHRPWASATGMPRNLFSQRSYRGINVWLLTAMGYASPFWATFQQVKTAGGSVRKGERGVPVVFWKVYTPRQTPRPAKPRSALSCGSIRSSTPRSSTAWPSRTSPSSRTASRPSSGVPTWWTPCRNRPTILHGHQRAFYKPATDTLHLPSPTCFQSPEAYYATVFHELVHAVGHRSRLNRSTLTDLCLFGDPTYAKEELVAEMGAAYLCGVCGIANATLANSAAYLQSWMQVLRQDPTMLVHAAAQAQKCR